MPDTRYQIPDTRYRMPDTSRGEASYSRSNESRHRFGSGCFNPTLTVVEKNMDDEYFYVENLAGEIAMTQSDGFA